MKAMKEKYEWSLCDKKGYWYKDHECLKYKCKNLSKLMYTTDDKVDDVEQDFTHGSQ